MTQISKTGKDTPSHYRTTAFREDEIHKQEQQREQREAQTEIDYIVYVQQLRLHRKGMESNRITVKCRTIETAN